MKINLLLDSNEVLNGYINIDPFSESQDRLKGEVTNLDFIIDAGEAEEILAYNILEYFGFDRIDDILNHWLGKLSKGGTLTIGLVDCDEVSRLFYQGRIDLDSFNVLLYGKQDKGWNIKKNAMTTYHLTEVLKNKGYKILKIKTDGINSTVTCQRI